MNGRASLTPFGLWGRTCRTVLNEIRRVLIVLSKLLVNGPFPPVPDYSRSYEKQTPRAAAPKATRRTIGHAHLQDHGVQFRLRVSGSAYAGQLRVTSKSMRTAVIKDQPPLAALFRASALTLPVRKS